MNRINKRFEQKPNNVCSIFVTAGFPFLDSTVSNVLELDAAGVDMVEIGMPFSDPLADGETIQYASSVAISNGMNIQLLFDQVREIRKQSEIPIVLMGYLNPLMRFGLEAFLQACKTRGVDGLIIPDITPEEYERSFQELFEKYEIPLTFLITPKTELTRIKKVEALTKSFIYFVSSASTTGKANDYSEVQIESFKRIEGLKLKHPILLGFGIHNHSTFDAACSHMNGGIIGSAFIRALDKKQTVVDFLQEIR